MRRWRVSAVRASRKGTYSWRRRPNSHQNSSFQGRSATGPSVAWIRFSGVRVAWPRHVGGIAGDVVATSMSAVAAGARGGRPGTSWGWTRSSSVPAPRSTATASTSQPTITGTARAIPRHRRAPTCGGIQAVTTRQVGRSGSSSTRNQRNHSTPRGWPAVDSQLGRPGSFAATASFHEPSGSYCTCVPLMVTGS